MSGSAIVMIRPNMDDLPVYCLPPGSSIRNFRRGDEEMWTEIESAAGEFLTPEDALDRFLAEFGNHLQEMESRCFFVVDSTGLSVGTATAWYNPDFLGESYGRVHWFGITRDFQGRGLAKPLLSAVMERLAQSHDKAYLKTHTSCIKAISTYLDFGFTPYCVSAECQAAWREVADRLRQPELALPR